MRRQPANITKHDLRLRRIAQTEHDIGLHEDALRESRRRYVADYNVRTAAGVDEHGRVAPRRPPSPPSVCPECDRVAAGELCICATCTPLWGHKNAAKIAGGEV